MARIIRVFPTATRATPRDELAVVDREPGFFDQADEVHISTLFSWDREKAERLARDTREAACSASGGQDNG